MSLRAGRTLICALALGSLAGLPAHACKPGETNLGVERIIQIDTAGAPIFGAITRYAHEPRFLRPKEIVLTFDDGPSPHITRSILKTLSDFCTKATFFPVGQMAIAHPEVIREIAKAGHTIGSHTWSHPNNLRRYRETSATDQIEKGFAAVAMAAGQPIAPFFRFPGLNDDARMLKHMQDRQIATFSVDVVSDDSYTDDPNDLFKQTVSRTIRRGGGILLFHDIKTATAHALPKILAELTKRGFKVVQLTSKAPLKPLTTYDAELEKRFAKSTRRKPLPAIVALRPGLPAIGAFAIASPPVTALAPERKDIERARIHRVSATKSVPLPKRTETSRPHERKKQGNPLRGTVSGRGWATVVDTPAITGPISSTNRPR